MIREQKMAMGGSDESLSDVGRDVMVDGWNRVDTRQVAFLILNIYHEGILLVLCGGIGPKEKRKKE